jgi:hypothetical protein
VSNEQFGNPSDIHTALIAVQLIGELLDRIGVDLHANGVDHYRQQVNKIGKLARGQGFDHPLK